MMDLLTIILYFVVSIVNPITPSSSYEEEVSPYTLSPVISAWSPSLSPRCNADESDESFRMIRRVFSFDDWDCPSPPQEPEVFHFNEWREQPEKDSDFDEGSKYTTMSYDNWLYDKAMDSKHSTIENSEDFMADKVDPAKLLPLLVDTTVSSLSGDHEEDSKEIPRCQSIHRRSTYAGNIPNKVQSPEERSSPSSSVPSVPKFIYVRKESRWRRQLKRSWRRIVRKADRRCEV